MTRSTPAASPAFLALACVGFVASAPAYAGPDGPEPDNDEQDRGQIVVTGQRQELEGPKATAKLVNTPRSVVILPEEVIEQTGSASLAEALRTVPGITFGAAEGGNPIGDRPFIRGFDSQGSTFVDGVRDVAAQTREVFATEQVQIVRGSDSTLGGRGSAGGSINVISKLPVSGSFIKASASVGTADYKRLTLDANAEVADKIGVRIAAMWHDQDIAGRDAIWSQRWGLAPSLTLGLGTDTRLTLAYYYSESHELPDSGIPFLYTLANAPGTGEIYSEPALGDITTIAGVTGHVDRSAYYGLKSRDFRDATTNQATLRVEHDFGSVTLRNTARYNHNDQAYIFLLPDDSQGNVFGTATTNPTTGAAGARGDVLTGGYVWRRGNTRYGYTEALTNQTDLYGTFQTGPVKHSFATGVEVSWEKARRGTFVTRGFLNANGVEILSTGSTLSPRCNTASIARGYCASLFNPNPDQAWVNYANDTSPTPAPIVRSLPIEETQNDASTVSVYGFDSITLIPSLILNLGARFDRFESKVTPGQAANATSTFRLRRTDELFNWQAGLVFKPTASTSLYASYATSATPPNSLIGEGQEANGLGTPQNQTAFLAALDLLDSLKVEKTKSYEVGAKAALFDEQLSLTLAAFQTDTDNARVTGPNNNIEFIGKRRIRGVEFNFNGNVTRWLNVYGGYTHLDPKIVDGGFTALTAPEIRGPGNVLIQAAKPVLVPSVNTGRQATQTAADSFTLWANLKPTSRLSIGGGAFYTSRVFGGYQDNRSATQNAAGVVTVNPATKVLIRTIPEYWRFDARLGYKISDQVELSVNVNNITDETYFTQAYTSHYATIAPGRSAFATIGIKF
ncbi:TonB-dependent receptor [Sphingomonas psychrotolerans]|uniref:TonB-dependent receptor n=1 Tax=Sphingomonas psychrotolerans TaxID=1327635 RepID=A0ABU3N6F7_9SPHN|nr:TonB-dependent receptor [Sphingomonas psychrotolerans]MDT8759444.1 TonB-dependent receptor [Sphingomonas psychrotolerans]